MTAFAIGFTLILFVPDPWYVITTDLVRKGVIEACGFNPRYHTKIL